MGVKEKGSGKQTRLKPFGQYQRGGGVKKKRSAKGKGLVTGGNNVQKKGGGGGGRTESIFQNFFPRKDRAARK